MKSKRNGWFNPSKIDIYLKMFAHKKIIGNYYCIDILRTKKFKLGLFFTQSVRFQPQTCRKSSSGLPKEEGALERGETYLQSQMARI